MTVVATAVAPRRFGVSSTPLVWQLEPSGALAIVDGTSLIRGARSIDCQQRPGSRISARVRGTFDMLMHDLISSVVSVGGLHLGSDGATKFCLSVKGSEDTDHTPNPSSAGTTDKALSPNN
jgi:hypothetical protein